MTKILVFTFLLCLYFSTVFGQTQKLILTTEQNNNWLDSLEKYLLDKQLFTINTRLLSDTNVFVKQSYPDRIKVIDSLGNRVYGYGKPTLIIDGHSMIIDNKTETSKIIGLTKLLTNHFIKNMSVLSSNDPATMAIYGSAGMSGIIVMKLTKKKYLKKFRRLNLKHNY